AWVARPCFARSPPHSVLVMQPPKLEASARCPWVIMPRVHSTGPVPRLAVQLGGFHPDGISGAVALPLLKLVGRPSTSVVLGLKTSTPAGGWVSLGATMATTMPMFSYHDATLLSYTALRRSVSPGWIFTFQLSGAPVTVIEKSQVLRGPPAWLELGARLHA